MKFTKNAMKVTQKLINSKDFKEYQKSGMATNDAKDINWWIGFVSFLIKNGKIK